MTFAPKVVSSFPGFESNLFKGSFEFSVSSNCSDVTFYAPSIQGFCNANTVSGYAWNFDDVLSGSNNTSTLSSTLHNFTSAGNYVVRLIAYNTPCISDTFYKTVAILPVQGISIIGKQNICINESTKLTASGAISYSWSNGATTASVLLTPSINTVYTISATGSNSCVSSKTVSIIVSPCLIINESQELSFKIYPNPIEGKFTLLTINACEAIITDLKRESCLQFIIVSGRKLS
jgi:PKD repeat protein